MTRDLIKQRLRAARELIDTPGKWTKGAFQRDAAGNDVSYYATALVPQSHCVTGAILSVCDDPFEDRQVKFYLNRFTHDPRKGLGHLALVSWNDAPERTHAEVMLAFDQAIEDVSHEEVVA